MKDTFRIGRIAGVSVGVNWSLLAVAALLTFGLAGGRYPVEAAGYSHSIALCMTIAAIQTGQRVTFDEAKQEVVVGCGDARSTHEQANR